MRPPAQTGGLIPTVPTTRERGESTRQTQTHQLELISPARLIGKFDSSPQAHKGRCALNRCKTYRSRVAWTATTPPTTQCPSITGGATAPRHPLDNQHPAWPRLQAGAGHGVMGVQAGAAPPPTNPPRGENAPRPQRAPRARPPPRPQTPP